MTDKTQFVTENIKANINTIPNNKLMYNRTCRKWLLKRSHTDEERANVQEKDQKTVVNQLVDHLETGINVNNGIENEEKTCFINFS